VLEFTDIKNSPAIFQSSPSPEVDPKNWTTG
jgi:hypothetical protein